MRVIRAKEQVYGSWRPTRCTYISSLTSWKLSQPAGKCADPLPPEHAVGPAPFLCVRRANPPQPTLMRFFTLALSSSVTRSVLLSRILSANATCWTAAIGGGNTRSSRSRRQVQGREVMTRHAADCGAGHLATAHCFFRANLLVLHTHPSNACTTRPSAFWSTSPAPKHPASLRASHPNISPASSLHARPLPASPEHAHLLH